MKSSYTEPPEGGVKGPRPEGPPSSPNTPTGGFSSLPSGAVQSARVSADLSAALLLEEEDEAGGVCEKSQPLGQRRPMSIYPAVYPWA